MFGLGKDNIKLRKGKMFGLGKENIKLRKGKMLGLGKEKMERQKGLKEQRVVNMKLKRKLENMNR